jgi:hypothetical protein
VQSFSRKQHREGQKGAKNMGIDSKGTTAGAGRTRRSVLVASLLMSVLLGTMGGVALKRLRAAERTGHKDATASHARPSQPQNVPSGKKCPPSIKLATLSGTVPTDPNHPEYDPMVLRRSGASAKDIFDSQPPGGPWAQGMQNGVGTQLVRDVRAVVPEVSNLEFVCKHWICSLSWTPMSEELDNRVTAVALLALVGPSVHFGDAPDRKALYFFSPAPDKFPVDTPRTKKNFDTSQPEKFAVGWHERRRRDYAAFNQGKKKLPPRFDAALRAVRLPE